MNIIVCIKQVPDTTEIKINPENNTLIREGVESVINPFDLYALEEAVRIKEEHGGKVTVISMGPPQVESALREALALGADEAVLISDRKFAGADTLATSKTLAAAITFLADYDLIICGKQAIDGDTAQVGPGVACHLNLPQVSFVKKIETIDEKGLQVQRMMEDGFDVIKMAFPALITVVKDINVPRLPSLRGKMKAKKAAIKILSAADLQVDEKEVGLNGSPTQVMKIFAPELKKEGEILHGDVTELADKAADYLTGLLQ